MKNVSVLILSFFTYVFSASGQDLTSFYFTEAQPAGVEEASFAPDTTLRYYSVEDSTRRLVIEGDTIFTEFTVYMVLTKKDMRQADTLEIRNEHLHGFLEDDSLPIVENKGKWFFGYPHKTKFFWPDEKHVIKQVTDSIYALNEKISGNKWLTTLVEIRADSVILHSFDHEDIDAMKPLEKHIESKEFYKVPTYLASPPKKEFISFVKKEGFNEREVFLRVPEAAE